MRITRRNFVSKLTVGLAGLPLVRGLSWAQTKGKLGYMKIVDNAADVRRDGARDFLKRRVWSSKPCRWRAAL